MRAWLLTLILLVAGLVGCTNPGSTASAASCASAPPTPDPAWRAEWPQVQLDTSRGALTLALEREGAPVTTANFLNLTHAGFYNGTQFHRVIGPTKAPPRGFVVQGGDPNSKDADPSNDGAGGPGYTIPDEFNPALRHDAAGTLSMANAGPDTGGSQFFLTLDATSYLDDRHSVFGRVTQGLDVLSSMGAVSTDSNDRPLAAITLTGAREIDPTPFAAIHKLGAHAVLAQQNATGGRATTLVVIVENNGTTRDAPAISASAPEGWSCSVEAPAVITAGNARAVLVGLTPPSGASGDTDVTLTARSAWNDTAPATTHMTIHLRSLGKEVKENDLLIANYVGLLPDGRLFDTSLASVGKDAAQPKLASTGGWRDRSAYAPFQFTVGAGVIPGFAKLAKGAHEGEVVAARIPKEDAYMQAACPGTSTPATSYCFPLLKRDLVFVLEIVAVK